MLTLKIEDKKVESIFLNEFHSNKEMFFAFIQSSYELMKSSQHQDESYLDMIREQETSMQKTWSAEEDKVWDEL